MALGSGRRVQTLTQNSMTRFSLGSFVFHGQIHDSIASTCKKADISTLKNRINFRYLRPPSTRAWHDLKPNNGLCIELKSVSLRLSLRPLISCGVSAQLVSLNLAAVIEPGK